MMRFVRMSMSSWMPLSSSWSPVIGVAGLPLLRELLKLLGAMSMLLCSLRDPRLEEVEAALSANGLMIDLVFQDLQLALGVFVSLSIRCALEVETVNLAF